MHKEITSVTRDPINTRLRLVTLVVHCRMESSHKALQDISLRFSEPQGAWTARNTERSQGGSLLCWTTLLFCHRRNIADFQALGKLGRDVAAARVQYMYLSSVHTRRGLHPQTKDQANPEEDLAWNLVLDARVL